MKFKTPYGRDLYETWYSIEQSIKKFDRLFNKVEKFEARKFSDPDHFQRREKRMLTRKRERTTENFTYFFGGLTEEEQMYRDYFETDLEEDPEDSFVEDFYDRKEIASTGQFDTKRFDFVETVLNSEPHENFEDLIEDKIFKFKYRMNCDSPALYERRQNRLVHRFADRAKTRNPEIEIDLIDLYSNDARTSSIAQFLLDETQHAELASNKTAVMREYMMNEGVQQFRDYYETDAEEMKAFEYLDNLDNRNRIRFMEIFEDYTTHKHDEKEFAMIPKREFNPELSAFSNVVLDLVDFRDRVRPLANDITLMDASKKYQRVSMDEIEATRMEFYDEYHLDQNAAEQGYSSGELTEGRHSASEMASEEPVAVDEEPAAE